MFVYWCPKHHSVKALEGDRVHLKRIRAWSGSMLYSPYRLFRVLPIDSNSNFVLQVNKLLNLWNYNKNRKIIQCDLSTFFLATIRTKCKQALDIHRYQNQSTFQSSFERSDSSANRGDCSFAICLFLHQSIAFLATKEADKLTAVKCTDATRAHGRRMSIIKQGLESVAIPLRFVADMTLCPGDLTGLTTFFVRLQHTVEDVCFASICYVFVYCSHALLYRSLKMLMQL